MGARPHKNFFHPVQTHDSVSPAAGGRAVVTASQPWPGLGGSGTGKHREEPRLCWDGQFSRKQGPSSAGNLLPPLPKPDRQLEQNHVMWITDRGLRGQTLRDDWEETGKRAKTRVDNRGLRPSAGQHLCVEPYPLSPRKLSHPS